MLIQRQGAYLGDVPVKLSLHSTDTGFVMIGDDNFRVLLDKDEVEQLHRLLGEFVSETGIKERL
jgi:hypothetical protein